jgi:hypothetical protein
LGHTRLKDTRHIISEVVEMGYEWLRRQILHPEIDRWTCSLPRILVLSGNNVGEALPLVGFSLANRGKA